MSNARTLASLIDDTNTRIKIPSGYGLDFSANTNVSGMTSEVLDDYEEGTFDGGLATVSNNTSISLSNDLMSYTKISNRVFVSGRVIISSITSPSGSEFYLTGLPFVIKTPTENETGSAGSVTYFDNSEGSYLTTPIANIDGKIAGYPYRWRMFKDVTTMGSSDQITFSFIYFTS